MDHPVAPDMPWISHCSLPHVPVESHIVLGFVPIGSPETAHRPHSDAEKHSIVLLTVSGTLTRALAVGRGGNYPSLSLARGAINPYQLGRMIC
jgi:hypothetical protein